ncbi:hypothetical protein D6C78_07978, partial [Aureobasidium pullulans]
SLVPKSSAIVSVHHTLCLTISISTLLCSPSTDLEAKTKILPSGKFRKPENQHQLNKCKLQELVQFDCEVKGHKKHKNGIVVCAPIVRVFRRCKDGLTVETTAWETEN